MRNTDPILKTFEQAVQLQVEQLKDMAKTLGDVASGMKSNNPSLNLWESPQGEMAHSINNVLQAVVFVTYMGDFQRAAKNLVEQASRMELLETEMESGERPSVIVRQIKAEIDKAIEGRGQPSPEIPC
jgi:hypothetical protein